MGGLHLANLDPQSGHETLNSRWVAKPQGTYNGLGFRAEGLGVEGLGFRV